MFYGENTQRNLKKKMTPSMCATQIRVQGGHLG